MFIDHFGEAFLAPLIIASGNSDFLAPEFSRSLVLWVSEHRELMIDIYYIMRTVGRIAFPIYCFLLVQGFIYTKNYKKYSLRLLAFAAVSEIPFDLAFKNTMFTPGSNNVFITLFICLVLLWLMSRIATLCKKLYEHFPHTIPVFCLYVLCGFFLLCVQYALQVKLLHSDYGVAAPVVIFIMYYLRKFPVVAYTLGTLSLIAINSSAITFMALSAVLPLVFYNGKRGKPMKYLFYVFYPAHLLLLVLMRVIFGL